MTSSLLWIAIAAGTAPGAGLSSEDFDKYFAEVQRARNQCGPVAVWYCLHRLGRETPFEEVNRQIEVGGDGASLQRLLDVLHNYGVPARALRAEPLDVRRLPCPCILIIGQRHCVVLERLEPSEADATIFETARREFITLPIADLTRQCSGEVIVFAEPEMGTAAFTAWVVCSLAVFLSLCAGMIGIGRQIQARRLKKQPGASVAEAVSDRPSNDVILDREQR